MNQRFGLLGQILHLISDCLLIGFVVSVFGLAAARGLFGRFLAFLAEIVSDKPDDDDIPQIGSADAVRIRTKVLWLAYPEARLLMLAL